MKAASFVRTFGIAMITLTGMVIGGWPVDVAQGLTPATAVCPPAAEVVVAHADGSVSVEGVVGNGCPRTAYFGSMAGHHLNQPIVALASTPDGQGYWLLAADGGIFTFGDAQFYGSTGSLRLNQPIVGMAATPDGKGYWLVGADGGIFTFGDAPFYGSTGAIHLNKPVVGIAADGTTGGYWLGASDGGIFAFHAPFLGSMGGKTLNAPIRFVTGTPDYGGYRLIGADGGVFDFGNASFFGSAAAPGSSGWDALAATPDGGGYWLFASSNNVVTIDAFGDAPKPLTLIAGDASPSTIVGAVAPSFASGPTITIQPVNQDVSVGGTATFTAAATGSPAPTVQWQSSTDGGTSFTNLPGYTSDTLSFTAAQFESGALLRAVFTNTAGSVQSAPALLTVIPAGEVIPSSTSGYFFDGSCGSAGECIAVGGTHGGLALIEKSTDGGSTFFTMPVPSSAPVLTSVDCNDALHCVAVGSSTALYSKDGGETWTAGTVPVPNVAGLSYTLTGVACGTDSVCAAVGAEVISTFQSAIAIHSTDGGVTWTNSTGLGGGPTIAASVECALSRCIAAGEDTFLSTDGGTSWTEKVDGVGALTDVACTTDQSACLGISSNPAGISMPTAAGFLDISTNQGLSWTPSSANMPPSTATVQTVACGGTSDCMIAGPSATQGGDLLVLTTVNSGASFTVLTGPAGYVFPALAPTGRFVNWPGVACHTATDCLVIGANSAGPVVSRTLNAGQTWSNGTVQ